VEEKKEEGEEEEKIMEIQYTKDIQIEPEGKKIKEIKNFEFKTNNKGRKPENKKEKMRRQTK